jgi:hypothetical protein
LVWESLATAYDPNGDPESGRGWGLDAAGTNHRHGRTGCEGLEGPVQKA